MPIIKQAESLPDYELMLILSNGDKIHLGTHPDTLAKDRLAWRVAKPVSVGDVATVRLSEQDKLISDPVAEVPLAGASTTDNGDLFEFETKRSLVVGIESFFASPIGKAICLGITLAIFAVVARFLPI